MVDNGGDKNLRTGDPGDVSTAAWLATVADRQRAVSGLAFSFRYVAGYGADGAPGGATLSLVALAPGPCGVGGALVATLYTSPVLDHYPYDVAPTNYSPPINVTIPAGSVHLNVSQGLVFGMRVHNNQRNLQILLPSALTIFWSA